MDIILSILIPTHNRPELFKRCLNSVIDKPDNVEIIVNNDTSDVDVPDGVAIFYNKFNNLTEIYQFLVNQAKGKYVWFLEDDDYAVKGFYKILNYLEKEYDVITGLYFPHKGQIRKTGKLIRNINFFDFQLSQCIFKKSVLDFGGFDDFCEGNCIHLDYLLFKRCVNVFNTKKMFFTQTCDAKDNLSFHEFRDLSKCKNCILKESIKK